MSEVKTKVPSSWELVKLGDFVESQKGKKPKNEAKTESPAYPIPYVDIQAFEEKLVRTWTDGVGCHPCYESDFLMVWDGSRSGLVGKGVNGALGSTLVRINFPMMVNDYAYYFLQSKYQQINTRAKGSGTPHVDPDLLWNYDFPIPPLAEQHRIVQKIEELFSELGKGIENLKLAQEQLKIYRQALLKDAFVGKLTAQWRKKHDELLESPEKLMERIQLQRAKNYKQQLAGWDAMERKGAKPKPPKSLPVLSLEELSNLPNLAHGWTWVRLGDIADLRGGITKGKNLEGKKTVSLPYLRVANVQDGYLNLNLIKQIAVYLDEENKYKLQKGDVLYTEGGDKDKLGRGAVWNCEIDNCIHQNHIFRARIFSGIYMPDLLATYSRTQEAKNYFFRHAKQTTNLASINLGVLTNIPVPICCAKEQKEVLNILKSSFAVAENIEKEIDDSIRRSERLRQSILQKAFSGHLVPQDPNDEPASELLARIKAEVTKSKPIKKKKA